METFDWKGVNTSEAQLFDRPGGGERAVLAHLDLPGADVVPEDALDELESLAVSAGATVVERVVSRRNAPDPRTFLGKGKVAELAELIATREADLLLVNHELSPSQERNLERAVKCRVLDRTGLILDIFAQRARTFEGKLQVELAQLRHIASRLVRGWSHLERQKGGIGLRGPGETQLETDRRLLGVRIKQLEKRLAKVRRQREQGRQARRKRELATVSLVGYTNAGKSTLFNGLTEAAVYADNRLFATLDTTLRRLVLPDGEPVVLADTVGFIRDLPHQLVAAFRSTLEEAVESQLLLHVIDAADPQRDESIRQVESVLKEIGADEIPRLRVYNKIDLVGQEPRRKRNRESELDEVWISSHTGAGFDLLLEAIEELAGEDRVHGTVCLDPEEGRLRARFFELGEVLRESPTDRGGSLLEVIVPRRDLNRLYRKEGLHHHLEPLAESD